MLYGKAALSVGQGILCRRDGKDVNIGVGDLLRDLAAILLYQRNAAGIDANGIGQRIEKCLGITRGLDRAATAFLKGKPLTVFKPLGNRDAHLVRKAALQRLLLLKGRADVLHRTVEVRRYLSLV